MKWGLEGCSLSTDREMIFGDGIFEDMRDVACKEVIFSV